MSDRPVFLYAVIEERYLLSGWRAYSLFPYNRREQKERMCLSPNGVSVLMTKPFLFNLHNSSCRFLGVPDHVLGDVGSRLWQMLTLNS